ncbi:MAG: FkbM family methyltransferase [Saprospiraceae bacterium]
MKLRHLIERLSRGIVFTRRLPAQFSKRRIFVSPEAGGLRYYNSNLGKIDTEIATVILHCIRPSQSVWDIGANLGYFSLIAADQVGPKGQILAIEPDEWVCTLLRKTRNANSDLDINILPVAVSNQNTISAFVIAQRARTTNHLEEVKGSTQTGGNREIRHVPVYTLDYLATFFKPPDFIKIDTEGAEGLVIEGASQVLSQYRPIVFCEIYSDNWEAIYNRFVALNYVAFSTKELPFSEIKTYSVDNVLFVPFEKISQVSLI